MSGVCGIVRFDGKIVKKEEIENMFDTMKNRGNDSEGIWVDGNVGFGHKMLWTTPESKYENLPIENDTCVLIMDARIDNRNELMMVLDLPDLPLEEIGDSEFILAAYDKWGEECSKYLLGDFVFAIWDKKEKKLLIVRDRFGIRPLYFFFNKGQLYFSSYINVLLNIIGKSFLFNYESIKSFMKFSTIKYEETMYKHVLRIPPAYGFIFSNNGLQKRRYWFPENIKIDYDVSLEEASKKVHELLFNAVESRLRIYGEWGCELSGGLDSSAVALIAKKLTNNKLFKTFSMRYKSYNCDEWEYTNEVIQALRCDPVYIDIDIKDDWDMNTVPLLSKHWPAYGSIIHNYQLGLSMIKSNVKVCLTGHGGDHVFTGTNSIISDYVKNFKLKQLFNEFSCANVSKFHLLIISIRSLMPKRLKGMIKSLFFINAKNNFLQPENFNDYWNIKKIKSDCFFNNLQYIVGRYHTTHTDNNYYRLLEMNENIEFRHPFLDTRLVEYVLSLPNYYKYSCSTIKIVLREALKDIYPDKIYKRKDKAEFSEVLYALMNTIDIQKLWSDSSLLSEELIDAEVLNNLLVKYEQKTINEVDIFTLWKLTCTALWFQEEEKNHL